MFRISNSFIGVLNILTLLISFPIISFGLWLRSHAASDCDRLLLWPILITGLFLMAVALLGFLGSCCNLPSFLWIYLFLMFFMILALLSFTVFAIVVTSRAAGEAVSGRGYADHRLGDYSDWLQKRVGDYGTWKRIKSCLSDAGVCGGLNVLLFKEANDFYIQGLSPIQSGCCKPPSYCGYKKLNATFWEVPKRSGPASNDTDCKSWSNDQKILCFDCISCKAGVLANIKTQWKKLALFNICLLVFLILIYSVGCCAFRNSRKDKYYRHRNLH